MIEKVNTKAILARLVKRIMERWAEFNPMVEWVDPETSVDVLCRQLKDAREENVALKAKLSQVDDVLVVNWVGPREDGDYRKALHDLVMQSIAIHDDPAVSEAATKREAELKTMKDLALSALALLPDDIKADIRSAFKNCRESIK